MGNRNFLQEKITEAQDIKKEHEPITKAERVFGCLVAFFVLACIVGVGYVAIHFITKWW